MLRKIIAITSCLLVAGSAYASTYTVNSTLDDVDATPGNDICATAGGVCTLRAAVQEANAHAGIDTISLPAGLFRLTKVGASEDLAATGDLDITEGVSVQGAGMDQTVIDGLFADRIFQTFNELDLTLSNLTLMRGQEPSADPGGGIYSTTSTGLITLSSVHFVDLIGNPGGAVFHLGSLSVSGSVFERNATLGSTGGVFFLAAATPKTITIDGSDFFHNGSAVGTAGVLFASGDYSVTISDSDFDSNLASTAGAVSAGILDGDITVSGSTFTGNSAGGGVGGAFFVSGGGVLLNISTSTFSDNIGGSGGGAVFFASGSTGELVVTGSTFDSNNAGTGTGGAINFSTSSGNFSITSSTISNNLSGVGGGVFVTSGNAITITDSTFEGNNAGVGPGGGAYLSAPNDINLTRAIFDSNVAGQGGGSFLVITGVGSAAVLDSVFEGNVAVGGPGGGLFNSSAAGLDITGSLLANNAAGNGAPGGGLYSVLGAGVLNISNSTVSGNSTSGVGGGIYSISADATVLNSTFYENTAVMDGGAIYFNAATFTVQNSILASSLVADNCAPIAVTSGNNNIDDDGSCGLALSGDSNSDPLLDVLADNGGLTKTHALITGSPAIDAFDNNLCPATDQRGVNRPFDGDQNGAPRCDKGAFEFNDACPTDPDKQVPGICGCGVPDADSNGNGITDCNSEADLFEQLGRLKSLVNKVKVLQNLATTKTRVKAVKELLNDETVPYFTQWGSTIALNDPGQDVTALFNAMKKAVKKGIKYKSVNFAANKKAAKKAIKKLQDQLAIP